MAENDVRNTIDWDDEFDMPEEEVMHRFREAVRIAKEVQRIKGKPTCEYDRETGRAYLLYPDGHKEFSSKK